MRTRRSLLAALSASAEPAHPRHYEGSEVPWFGYYDKLQFDPSSRYALGVENGFEHRLNTETPRAATNRLNLAKPRVDLAPDVYVAMAAKVQG